MAAGLGFKTFNTGDVLSAADTNGYLMQGVWVFADATARDAAVTSPQEGNFAYLKDTNITTYYTGSAWANLDTTGMTNPMTTTGDTIYSSTGSTPARLGIGTAGQVLRVNSGATAPEWATPSATASGLTYITGGTFTTSSTININDIFSSTYQNYKIFLDVSASSGNFDWTARLRVGGSDNSNSTYNSQGAFFDGGTGYVNKASQAEWFIGNCISGVNALEMTIYSPNQTNQTKFGSTGASTARTFIHGGVFTATTTFTGLSLLTTSNNATGNYRVYGLANS